MRATSVAQTHGITHPAKTPPLTLRYHYTATAPPLLYSTVATTVQLALIVPLAAGSNPPMPLSSARH